MRVRIGLIAVASIAASACTSPAGTSTSTPATETPQTPKAPQIALISTCAHPVRSFGNSEVEEAAAPPGYLYAAWIGCDGIGFAASPDDGQHWSHAITVPQPAGTESLGGTWDPAIAVSPDDGTVYVSYMRAAGGTIGSPGVFTFPVLAVSADHGSSFAHVYAVKPPTAGNFGDRDFIAAGPAGTLYLTWDYGLSGAKVTTICGKGGSCAFGSGDLNVVAQVSHDHGQTWSPITPVQPGYPNAGGDSAPLILNPRTGTIDVLYLGHQTDPGTLKLHPGYEYFTSSPDGTHWPAQPIPVQPDAGSVALSEWWIDGAITADAAGNLYATWDTQASSTDVGWLSVSADQGRTWSAPSRVTPDGTDQPHIVEAAGGPPGVAYLAWQTSVPAQGYALFIRSYENGRLGPVRQVSVHYGNPAIWPGDTFGITALPDGKRVALTWGSAVRPARLSQIYATTIMMGA